MSSQARPTPRLAPSNAQVDAFESEDEWKNDLVMGMRLSLEEAINKAKKNLCKELERASPEDCTRLASKWNDKINAINGLVDGQYGQELEEERRKGFISHTTSSKAQDELYGLGYHRDTEHIDNVEDYSYQRELNNEHNYLPWVAGQSAPPGWQAYHNSDGIQRNTVTGFDYPSNPANLQSSLPNINERTPDFRCPHVSVAPPIPIPTGYRETERASGSFLPLPPMVPFGHTSLTTASNSEGMFGSYIQPPKHGSFLQSSSLSSESSLASLAQSWSSSSSSSQFYRGDTQRDQFKETKKGFYEWPEQLQEYPEQQQEGERVLYTENRNVEWYPPHYGSGEGQNLKREPDGNGAYMKFKEMLGKGNRTTARGREVDHRVLTTATSYDTSSSLRQYDQNMQSHIPIAFPPPLISMQQPSYNTTSYDATTEEERSILRLAEETRKRAENIHEREAALSRREMEINQREENARRKEKEAYVEASRKLADLELHRDQAQKYEQSRRMEETQGGHARQRSVEARNVDKRKLMEQIHVILQQPNEQPAEQVLVAPNRQQGEREREDEMVAEAIRHLQNAELTDDLLGDPILREEQKFIWEQTKYHLKANETIQRKREERRAKEKRKEAAARQEYETRQREPSQIAQGAQTRADHQVQERRQHQREEARNMSAGRRYQPLYYDGDNIQIEKLLADPNVVEEQAYILKQLIERQARPIEQRRQEERYLHDSFEDSNFGSSSASSSLGPRAPRIYPPPPPTRPNRLASTLPSSFKQHDVSTSSGMDTLSKPTYNKLIPLTDTSSARPSRPSVATQPISKASLDVPSLGKPRSGSVSFGAYSSPDQSEQFRCEQARLMAEDARAKEVVSKAKKDKVSVQNTEERRPYEQVSNIQEAQAAPKEDTRRRETRTTERVATEISRQKKSEGPPSKSRTTRRAVDSTPVAAFAAITAPRRDAKRATVEDASDDEKDYRGETIPVDSRAIFEDAGPDVTPKPSMPPGPYNSTYNDTGERNEASRGPSGQADTSEASWGGNGGEMELSFENIWGR